MEERVINIGLIAHVDAGKTTLTEQLLYCGGVLRKPGNVDSGTTQTDWLSVERERGISVKSCEGSFLWQNVRVNLIDTPGHSDFLGEVERALSVLDGAVLIVSAVEGVQAGTELLLHAAQKLKLPLLCFINKIDRMGSDYDGVYRQLASFLSECGRHAFAVNVPAGTQQQPAVRELPFLQNAEDVLTACGDDALLEDYLAEKPIAPLALQQAVCSATSQARAVPVLCGASKFGAGVPELLQAVCAYFSQRKVQQDDLCGRVYRVEHDKAMGKIAYVRLFSGSIQNRDAVYLPRTGTKEKVTQIRRAVGHKQLDTGRLCTGDIAALCGLSGVRAGDRIGEGNFPFDALSLTTPLLTVRAYPAQEEQLPALVAAFTQLCDEDPLLDFIWVREKRELHIKLTGLIQLEILTVLLKERYDLDVAFSKPCVIYKETPCMQGIGFDAYTMPKPCWAVVKLLITPLKRGEGFRYEADVPNDKLFYRYQEHIRTAVPRALQQGPLGWQVTDLSVKLIDGEHHTVHTHPMDFFVATPMAIADGLRNTGTRLLEPVVCARFTAPEEFLGKTISLAVAARGEFDTPVLHAGQFTLEVKAPAAELLQAPVEFASFTGGRGVYSASFLRYEDCPPGVGETAPRIGPDPLDRPKFILYARQALTQ